MSYITTTIYYWVECEIPVPQTPIRRGHIMTADERAAIVALEADRCEIHGLYKCVECAEAEQETPV